MSCRVTVVDAYDSFVHILVAYFEQLDCLVTVRRHDDPSLLDLISPGHTDMIVLGPGPGHPAASGYDRVLHRNGGTLPVLGVCLGHQAIGLFYGGNVDYARHLLHGKTSAVQHDGRGCFRGLGPQPLQAMRYHSIIVADHDLPDELCVSARSLDDGYIMGLRHRHLPVESVQFHPESIGTDSGLWLIRNFMDTHGLLTGTA